MKRLLLFYILGAAFSTAHAQTRALLLQGRKTPLRSCYNVLHYQLQVQPDFATRSLSGRVQIRFRQEMAGDSLQLDLFPQLTLDSLLLNGQPVKYRRDEGAVLISTGATLKADTRHELTVRYHGQPIAAKKAPWDGGLVWKADSLGRNWLGTAVQGMGGSAWWPCKDDVSDKPDSGVTIQIDIPEALTAVSNGQRLPVLKLDNGLVRHTYQVTYPINVYNVTLNVGHYQFAQRQVTQADGTPLSMEVAALDYDLPRYAPFLFDEAKRWLSSVNRWFGPYPWVRDGYRLCQTDYWGMEHQSCISYGNKLQRNPQGFDFIVVHESGHEYWGNLITEADPAHMWIHEAFCTYSEALYMEHHHGRRAAQEYLHDYALPRILNKSPLVGPEGEHYNGFKDADMYFRGALMIETFRNGLNNDTLFAGLLKGILHAFTNKPVTTNTLLAYIDARTGQKWTPFFQAYLYSKDKPHFKVSQGRTPTLKTAKGVATPFKISQKEVKRLLTKPQPLDSVKYYFTLTADK